MNAERLHVAITGATGFLGNRLSKAIQRNCDVLSIGRRRAPGFNSFVTEFADDTNFTEALAGVDVLVHCAAAVHDRKRTGERPVKQVNVDATLKLARDAASMGVKRFIFISSLSVNGAATETPLQETAVERPDGLYAESKFEAERGLWKISRDTALEVVIVRPPMIYGPECPGNFAKLARWIDVGLPLPFGAVRNRRSFVFVDNVVDLIKTCLTHPNAANQLFFVSDGQDVSTAELTRRICSAKGKLVFNLSVPPPILYFVAKVIGRSGLADKLLKSFQVDISKARNLLGWAPRISIDDAFIRCFEIRGENDKYRDNHH